ncbi:MAG: hypothetical protein JO169_12875 [Solirubrobacterales bacterium]|nr:hypothetical protein [Solirubrobacterales bacterium]MBV9839478.1 hypothetical protein [Solirubrobacterales bacterium]
MHRFKRALTLIAVTAVCSFPALSLAACGSTAHLVGGVAAHHIANHFARTPAARRRVNKVFCLYHGHRVLVDLRTHHVFAAGLNAVAAYRACKAGFGRH